MTQPKRTVKGPKMPIILTPHRGVHSDDDIVPLRRRKVMEVLTRNTADAGCNLTTRRFNKILTDLGFRLEES